MGLDDQNVPMVGENHQLETIGHEPDIKYFLLRSVQRIKLVIVMRFVLKVVVFTVGYGFGQFIGFKIHLISIADLINFHLIDLHIGNHQHYVTELGFDGFEEILFLTAQIQLAIQLITAQYL